MQRPPNPTMRRHAATALLTALALTGSVHADDAPARPARPDVLVNQIGYFRNGPKRATLVSAAPNPVPWELRDRSDATVASGLTEPFGHDPTAGLDTHVIDFSTVRAGGSGYTLVADGERSLPFTIGLAGVYADVRDDALEFFYPARSGVEIEAGIVAEEFARPAGHVSAPGSGAANQGDVDVPCAPLAGCPAGYSLDVVGGWYDAGDHGKYVVSGAIATTHLLSLYERTSGRSGAGLGDGDLALPEAGNGVPDVLDEARWELEWLLSMQVPGGTAAFAVDGRRVDLSGMVHHKVHDARWTELPTAPDEDTEPRRLFGPSTAATLDFAAVTAQGARVWREFDAGFADRLLAASRRAFSAARAFPTALYAPPSPAGGSAGGGAYDDITVADEFYWAATELYLTTGAERYRDLVVDSPMHRADVFSERGFTWRDVAALARLRLATVPNGLPDRDVVRASVVAAAGELLDVQAEQSMGQPYAGAEGRFEWGSNAQLLHNLMVLAAAGDVTGDAVYRDAVRAGVDYLFGRNALGWSYVTGWGAEGRWSQNQHSRWWAAQLDDGLPHPPDGALAGGPNSDTATWDPTTAARHPRGSCAPQQCYVDDIGAWATNEVVVNWQAALAWVAAYLAA